MKIILFLILMLENLPAIASQNTNQAILQWDCYHYEHWIICTNDELICSVDTIIGISSLFCMGQLDLPERILTPPISQDV